jgi:uncharacterized protein (TIRG00374 family)
VTRSSVGRLLRALVTILLTGIVLWRAEPSAVVQAGARADLGWIMAAVALVAVDRALMAYRWLMLLCPIEPARRPPRSALLRVFFVSTFAGTFLPASVGGDLVRAYSLSRLNVPRGAALASVMMDRLLGVVSLVVAGTVGLVLAGRRDLFSSQAVTLSLTVAALVSVAGAAAVFSGRAADLIRRLAEQLPLAQIRALGGELAQATRAYARHHAKLVNVLAGSVGVQILRIVQAYCLGRALGLAAPLAVYFAFIPLILLIMLLPVSINGIGPAQAAFVWFFAPGAATPAEAFALSVLFLALGVVGNLPGGLLYAWSPLRRAPGAGARRSLD